MPLFLNTADKDFESGFKALLTRKRESSEDVNAQVSEIIAQVRAGGDAALCACTARFDRMKITPEELRISPGEVDAALEDIPEKAFEALTQAARRIRVYHRAQMPEDKLWEDEAGVTLGWRWRPVDAAGLYVPGGLASYPSSLLMNAIPAQVAGVKRLVICVPTPDGQINPLVLAAARLVGVDELYRIGGAQAIAAMAYGTQSIQPVDTITGPGNAYVAAAKRQVYGQVGIDSIAGPSEILVIADEMNNPEWLALDLLSQAEHDPSAQAILITDSLEFGKEMISTLDRKLHRLHRHEIAGASWQLNGAVIVVRNFDEAARLADRIAPEHLELCVKDPEALAAKVKHAGAIFLGAYTPEAVGDYIGGPNHVLPTARTARFSSGLSVLDFLKRTTMLKCSPDSLKRIGPAAALLAEHEQLEAHALSIYARLRALNDGDG